MKKYEYRALYINTSKLGAVGDRLNEVGSQGYRLVAINFENGWATVIVEREVS